MDRRISLRHLRCFLALVETRSFTVAASRMFLSQSSLTAAIQQFEEIVEVKLFKRTTRQVELTEAGDHFKHEAEEILNRFDASIRDLKAFGQGGRMHIRIASAPSVVQSLVVPAIPYLREVFPELTFTLRDADATRIERMLIHGEIDFALSSKHTGSGELEHVPLLQDHYGIVCRPPSRFADGNEPVRWRDLPVDGYVQFTPDTALGVMLSALPAAKRLYKEQSNAVSSSTTLYAMLGLPGTYSIAGALTASADPFPEFHYRELVDPILTREICLVTRRLRYMSPNSKLILRTLLQHFKSLPLPRGATLLQSATELEFPE
ncbi:LysR family transcriptional regulator [Alcaligenaceae bacterium]|nr:LysR family transcriptional regulator [Alcaligenaceae bacterium]